MAELEAYEANALVEQKLNECVDALEIKLNADVLAFSGAIYYGADLLIREAVEWRKQQRPKKNHLAFFLETTGGYIEVVQRIVTVLRRHYRRVEFYVPNTAMSAGTVLVMSGDDIHMDYYSILGPIDPQLPKRTKTRGLVVTSAMKKARAKKIAEILNETDIWHSHGHGISMAVLRSNRINLQIKDFGADKDLSQKIRDYWSLLSDHMEKLGVRGVIHVKGRYKHLIST